MLESIFSPKIATFKNRKFVSKKYGIIAIATVMALAAGLIVWGLFFKKDLEVSEALANGTTANATNPENGEISIQSVEDTSAIQESLPDGFAVHAFADFTIEGDLPTEWQEIRFELSTVDPDTNYVIGHYATDGQWEFVPTKLDGNTLVARVSHFSWWGVVTSSVKDAVEGVSNALTGVGDFMYERSIELMEFTGHKYPEPECLDKQPPWSNVLSSTNETQLLTWCADETENGNLRIKIVNNVGWPLPVKFAVKPDRIVDLAYEEAKEAPSDSVQALPENDSHWMSVDGAEIPTLIIPSGTKLELEYSESTIATELKGQDKKLFGVDYEHYPRYAMVDTLLDGMGIFTDFVNHINSGQRARLTSMIIAGGGDACRFTSDDLNGTYDCWHQFIDPPDPESFEYLMSSTFTGEFLQDHFDGKPAHSTLRSYFVPSMSPETKFDFFRVAVGFGTAFGQIARVGLGWSDPVPDLVFRHNMHFTNYMKNHAEWTDYKTPDGRLTFKLPPYWKVEQDTADGFLFVEKERNVLKIVDEESKDIAKLITGLAPTGLESGPQEPGELREFDSLPLDPKNLSLGDGNDPEITFVAQATSTSGDAIASAGLVRPNDFDNVLWSYSPNSAGYFHSTALGHDYFKNQNPLDFDRTPEYFELRRMMTSLRFVPNTEPKKLSVTEMSKLLVDDRGMQEEDTVEEPTTAEPAKCEGALFIYDTSTVNCDVAKKFVQKLIDTGSGGAGGYEHVDLGHCYMNDDGSLDCWIKSTGQEFQVTSKATS